MSVDSRVLAAPDDGSLGPLLRVTEDRLAPGERYGVHEHRAVDVVVVVLAGSVRHEWGPRPWLTPGDVGFLRAGAGLRHDERAGPDGAHVVQCYLRTGDPAGPPSHAVLRVHTGWVDLGRPDARLWVGRDGGGVVPDGQVFVVATGGVPPTTIVWQVDTDRPDWARD